MRKLAYMSGLLILWGLALSWACQGPLDVRLDRLQPNQVLTGQAVKVSILGKGFPEGPVTATLEGVSNKVVLVDVKRIDAGTLEATVPESAAVGQYDFKIAFGDNSPVVLGGAFEILPNALRIVFLNIGQGDATLLVSPSSKTMLIDAGPPGQAEQIADVLQQLNIKQIDHVVATHYDSDHVGSFEALLNGPDGKQGTEDDITIKEGLWDHGETSKNQSYSRVRQRYQAIHKPLDGSSDASFPRIDLGAEVSVQVRATNGVILKRDGTRQGVPCGDDENCRSVGVLVEIGKFRMWTAGDLTGGGIGTPDVETTLANEIGVVDVYRAHHHGSKTSSNQAWLDALKPKVIVISAGKDNSYCHPHAEVLERMVNVRDVWLLLTTAGVLAPGSCGSTTTSRMSTIGKRGVVDLGSFSLLATPNSFSVRTPSETVQLPTGP